MTARVDYETAADRTRRLWEETEDATFEGTAIALLTELGLSDEAIVVLLPWVKDRVRNAIRSQVREAEEAVWPSGVPLTRHATAVRSQTGALPDLGDLEKLLKLPVTVPVPGEGAQSVAWKDMTIADHEARIGMLRRPLNGIQRTIERHEWSIREIRKYGVDTLGAIPVDVLRSDF